MKVVDDTVKNRHKARLGKRRAASRIRLEAPIEVDSGGVLFHGEAMELSERGMCLTTLCRVPPRRAVTIRLTVPRRDGTRVTCAVDGDIVGQRGDRLAIAFSELKAGQYLRLRDYVWRVQQAGLGIERRRLAS